MFLTAAPVLCTAHTVRDIKRCAFMHDSILFQFTFKHEFGVCVCSCIHLGVNEGTSRGQHPPVQAQDPETTELSHMRRLQPASVFLPKLKEIPQDC